MGDPPGWASSRALDGPICLKMVRNYVDLIGQKVETSGDQVETRWRPVETGWRPGGDQWRPGPQRKHTVILREKIYFEICWRPAGDLQNLLETSGDQWGPVKTYFYLGAFLIFTEAVLRPAPSFCARFVASGGPIASSWPASASRRGETGMDWLIKASAGPCLSSFDSNLNHSS